MSNESPDFHTPAFMDQLYPETAFHMVSVLEKAGCQVTYNPNQTCCGQPAFNSGYWKDAQKVACKLMQDLEGDSWIVTPSASCTGFVRNYYKKIFEQKDDYQSLDKFTSRLIELSEFLTKEINQTALGAYWPVKATYHDSCAALRECKIKEEPRKLLAAVEGLELVEMEQVETCCGFGGTFSVKFDEISVAMAAQKVHYALQTGAEYIISTDISCLMQLEGYIQQHHLPIKTIHLAEVLNKSGK